MQRLPPFTLAHKFPVTSVLAASAIAVSLAWWGKVDVTPLFESFEWPRQPWRLLTSALLHVNAIHLVFNLYWLWGFGTLLERRFGPLKIALIYVLLASASGAAEFAFLQGGVGLSGVVYGLFGLLFVLAKYDRVYAQVVDPQTVQLFVGWFFICIVTTMLKIMPVGNIAHGVGALVGYMLGLAIVSSGRRRQILSGALVLLTVFSLGLASVGRESVNLSGDVSLEYWQRGTDALDKGENEAAIAYFKRALAIKNTEKALWFNLGIAHHRLRQADEAIDAYQHAWDLGHHDEKLRRILVELKSYQGYKALTEQKWEKAEQLLKGSLALDDSPAMTWRYLAVCYQHQQKDAEAKDAFENADKRGAGGTVTKVLDAITKPSAPPKK